MRDITHGTRQNRRSAIIGRHYHHVALGRRVAFSRDVVPVTASRWEFVACYGAGCGA